MMRSVDEVNERQKRTFIDKINAHFAGKVQGKTIAIWGMAFKPRTDDIREAPALVLIDWLVSQGAIVQVHDPEAIDNVRQQYGDKLAYCSKPMKAIDGADALAIMTEWGDYQRPEFKEMFQRMRTPVIFDGRNLYEPWAMERLGFVYYSVGRPAVGIPDKEAGRQGDRERR
jgi:UDPglucose 6-dehydrogenase